MTTTITTPNTPRLQVGQVWRDRAGRVCTVVAYDGPNEATDTSPNWSVTHDGDTTRPHYGNGCYYGRVSSSYDLVKLVYEAPTAALEAAPQQSAPPRFTNIVPPHYGVAYAIAEDGSLWYVCGTSATRVTVEQQ